MSYPIEYDELLSRDQLMKGFKDQFDNIHKYLKDVRKDRSRSKELRPHKVAKHISSVLRNYVRNIKPEYISNVECDEGGHIPTKVIGQGLYQCELCTSTFQLIEIGEFQ